MPTIHHRIRRRTIAVTAILIFAFPSLHYAAGSDLPCLRAESRHELLFLCRKERPAS